MLELPKYLVEVGEPYVSPKGMILLWEVYCFLSSHISCCWGINCQRVN